MEQLMVINFLFDEITYTAKAKVDYDVDPNYGADADNRRGVSTCFVHEVEVIAVYFNDVPLKNLPDGMEERIATLAEERLNVSGT